LRSPLISRLLLTIRLLIGLLGLLGIDRLLLELLLGRDLSLDLAELLLVLNGIVADGGEDEVDEVDDGQNPVCESRVSTSVHGDKRRR
jgi:hypothetical protein